VFVGLNPLLLVYAVGGGHNDLPLMLCVTAAAAHLGRFMHPYGAQNGPRRRGVAGVAAAVASAIKASALFVIPPLVLSRRALIGFAAGAGAAALIGLAVIGPGLAEFPSALAEQSKLTSEHSVPTELSRWLGLDGPTDAVRALAAATFGIVLALLVGRTLRGGDPIAAAAWAAIAALVTTAWLMPWYVVWALPLAALAPGRGPRAAALGVCAFVVATRFELLLA
jgi:hypothetical protein